MNAHNPKRRRSRGVDQDALRAKVAAMTPAEQEARVQELYAIHKCTKEELAEWALIMLGDTPIRPKTKKSTIP